MSTIILDLDKETTSTNETGRHNKIKRKYTYYDEIGQVPFVKKNNFDKSSDFRQTLDSNSGSIIKGDRNKKLTNQKKLDYLHLEVENTTNTNSLDESDESFEIIENDLEYEDLINKIKILMFHDDNKYPLCFSKSFKKCKEYNAESIVWLECMAILFKTNIQHVENGGEFVIPNIHGKRPNGYSKDINWIFEFHVCQYHGCPKCFRDRHKRSPVGSKKSYKLLYKETMEMESLIKQYLHQAYPIL